MTKQPINQSTLSCPLLSVADYAPPTVETITNATQEEIGRLQAADPAITKIIETLTNANAAKHPTVFFMEEGILYRQVKDLCQIVIPASLVDQMLH
uniref:Uncharacterized protein n=1 Tax=Romanomermis culicivorax TaxID=13658 RepID=A0A915L5Y5_ROMCU